MRAVQFTLSRHGVTGRLARAPLGAARSGVSCARLVSPARRVHAAVASTTTQELLTVTEAPSAASPGPAGGPGGPAGGGSSSSPPTSFRLLPQNYAPETTFTVDNVAAADVAHFTMHPSVAYWSDVETRFTNFWNKESEAGQVPAKLEDVPAAVASLLASALAAGDAEAAAYWAYHVARTTFFLGAAAAGAVTHHLAHQAQALLRDLGLPGGGSASGASSGERRKTPFDNLSANARAEVLNRLQEAFGVFRRDLQYVKEGQYKLPWDMTDLGNRQYNPLYAARMTAAFCAEAVATLNRRLAQGPADNWFASNLYPRYYADNTFHYQSDGWFSSRSAAVYEYSTETLFFGRQDAMQRTSLLPLAQRIRERGLDPTGLRLAEVGCGTGRFHTFIKDNYPAMRTIAADLSPFYLARARDNVNYWRAQRAAGLDLGGPEGTGVQYMQAAMEALPAADASLDVVVCVYCFHEMPEEARAAAAAEWFRVLRPGGLVVLTDSVQLGDRPAWNDTLGNFHNMNEPHYRNYIACDLGSLFDAAGFECGTKYLSSATKTLSFTKPEPALPAGGGGGGSGGSSGPDGGASWGGEGSGTGAGGSAATQAGADLN